MRAPVLLAAAVIVLAALVIGPAVLDLYRAVLAALDGAAV